MKLAELLSNKFIRITLMVFFFLFVYKILYAIGIFFAVDPLIISMYLCWIGMLILFASLLPVKKTLFNIKTAIPEPILPIQPLPLPNEIVHV